MCLQLVCSRIVVCFGLVKDDFFLGTVKLWFFVGCDIDLMTVTSNDCQHHSSDSSDVTACHRDDVPRFISCGKEVCVH